MTRLTLLIALSFLSAVAASISPGPAACGPGKVATYSDVQAVWYERTGCFGRCPGYQVVFSKYGDCYYIGFEYVLRLGRYAQTCSSNILKQATQVLQRHEFYRLNYDSSILVTDVPHYIVAAERCGVTTKLDWPAFQDRKDIESLFDGLDAVTEHIRWHKISNSAEPMER
jgi:Domain of unknown function (DUF6438)